MLTSAREMRTNESLSQAHPSVPTLASAMGKVIETKTPVGIPKPAKNGHNDRASA